MCEAHYQAWLRWGHPFAKAPKRTPYEKVMRRTLSPEIGCWHYDTLHSRAPRVVVDGRQVNVAIVVWEHYHGHVPEGGRLRRLCATVNCVRPDHHQLQAREQAA